MPHPKQFTKSVYRRIRMVKRWLICNFVEGQGLQSDCAAVRRVSCAYTKVSNARLKVLRDAVPSVMAITDARNRFWQDARVSGIAAQGPSWSCVTNTLMNTRHGPRFAQAALKPCGSRE
jgi:hypothetical protein